MNKVTVAGLVAAAMLVGAPAHADEPYQEMRPYVSGLFSYVAQEDDRGGLVGDSTRAFNEGKGLQLSVGKALNRWLGFEVAAFGHKYSRDTTQTHMNEYGAKLDGLFFYSRDPNFSPYFGVGVGGIRTEISGNESSSDPFADVGLGFMKFFDIGGHELGVRGDVRYRRIFFDGEALRGSSQDDVEEAVLKFGIVIPLGARPRGAPEKPDAACADSDGDGVCDTADLCPETPKGTAVDDKGCPVERTAKGDPNQKFDDVHFAFDKSDLTDYAKTSLDGAAKVINDLATNYPQLKIDIGGHTDWDGTDGYNQALSERRANIVRQYLQRKGVDAGRMNVQAYGETRPKATNETDEGRALNRRTEVRAREK